MKLKEIFAFDVVSFGGAVVDCFLNTGVGETHGKICYNSGEKILVKDLKFDVGGGAKNTAAAFSRLGLKTGCVIKVGDDENGRKILRCLKDEKVKLLGKVEKNSNSGFSVILDSREYERTILTFKGSNDQIEMNDIKHFRTKWLYLSSLLEKSFNTQLQLAKELKKKWVKIAFNPSAYIIKEYKDKLKSLLKLCDIVILNKEEAQMLVKGKSLPDLLKNIHKLGVRTVVITNKNSLVGCYDGNKMYSIKPHENIKVVERTGAGDAFASGFVAGQIVGKTIDESLELALKESESVLGHFGAKNNLIRMKLK